MSSTNRSDSRDTHTSDYYVTPIDDIRTFLNVFLANHPEIILSEKSILDPCAGGNPELILPDGTIVPANPMSYPEALSLYTNNIPTAITNDIRPDSPAMYHTDFLSAWNNPLYDFIITNPPFNLALPIIEKSLDICLPGGYVIMLLRLNFFGSKARRPFFQSHMPIETYVHHKRISFAKGATDSIEYMHCVWKRGENPNYTKLYII